MNLIESTKEIFSKYIYKCLNEVTNTTMQRWYKYLEL